MNGKLTQTFRIHMDYWIKEKNKVGFYALSDLIFHLISVGDNWNLNASNIWDTLLISC